MNQLSLQAGRVAIYQDVGDSTEFAVRVTDDGVPVDLSVSTWSDPDGLMSVDTADAANGNLTLTCPSQPHGEFPWRLVSDEDTTWLEGVLVVGSTHQVWAQPDVVQVRVQPATIRIEANAAPAAIGTSHGHTGGSDGSQIDHGALSGLGDDDHPQYLTPTRHAEQDHTLVGADHGALSGLEDDDHTQYLNGVRHDARDHDALGLDHGALAGLADDDHPQYLTEVDHAALAHESGASDHGELTGLADDDHAQYLTEVRHDAHDHTAAAASIASGDLADHNKATHDALNLNADTVDGQHAADFESAGAVADHEAAGDPHTQYVNEVDHTTAQHDALSLHHGGLSGLADDDHPHYHDDARHDAHDHTAAAASISLDDLGNVSVPTPADGEALIWDETAGQWVAAAITEGGVTDHGALSGLADDDHPHYLNGARHDSRSHAALLPKHQVDFSELTDGSAATDETWEPWGVEEITFADPGASVKVYAILTGWIDNAQTVERCDVRVAVSFDGGATFQTGRIGRAAVGGRTRFLETSPTQPENRRADITAVAYRSGTPTGSIVVRGERLSAGGTNSVFTAGSVIAHLVEES